MQACQACAGLDAIGSHMHLTEAAIRASWAVLGLEVTITSLLARLVGDSLLNVSAFLIRSRCPSPMLCIRYATLG